MLSENLQQINDNVNIKKSTDITKQASTNLSPNQINPVQNTQSISNNQVNNPNFQMQITNPEINSSTQNAAPSINPTIDSQLNQSQNPNQNSPQNLNSSTSNNLNANLTNLCSNISIFQDKITDQPQNQPIVSDLSQMKNPFQQPTPDIEITCNTNNFNNIMSTLQEIPKTNGPTQQEKFVYNYYTDKILYSINFQKSQNCRIAIGTLEKCEDSSSNKIEILEMDNNNLCSVTSESMEYPSTKLMWSPNENKNNILASSSDCMKLYEYNENEKKLYKSMSLVNKKSQYKGALTSFDWNNVNDSILGTASLDTTCTIWDLNKSTIKTQLIAHDKEVFDISFSNNEHSFISSGADGSVRLFDLRNLDHSTIIYETKPQSPITKIAWNLNNSNFIAALSWEKSIVYIFDSRVSNVSLVELKLHKAPVTGMVWSPNNQSQICSVSEDKNVIISNIQSDGTQNNNVCYPAPHEINNVAWCCTLPEWIGITLKQQVQLLRK